MKLNLICLSVLLLIATSIGTTAATDDNGVAHLSKKEADSIGRSNSELHPLAMIWRYHPGDSSIWADPAYDDSSWALAPTTWEHEAMPITGESEIGWFRLRLVVDSELVGRPLSYRLALLGAANLYVNGQLIHSAGRVSRSATRLSKIIEVKSKSRVR